MMWICISKEDLKKVLDAISYKISESTSDTEVRDLSLIHDLLMYQYVHQV